MLRDARQHPRPQFFVFMERERHIRPPRLAEDAMRTFLTLDVPAGAEECAQDVRRLSAAPLHI